MCIEILFKNGTIETLFNVQKISTTSMMGSAPALIIYYKEQQSHRPRTISMWLIDSFEVK